MLLKLNRNGPKLHIAMGLVFLSIFFLFFHSVLLSNNLLLCDGMVPAYFKVHSWTNFLYSGFPIAADPIWHAFYPLRIIIYKVFNLNFNFFIISSYFLTAVFTYLYIYFLTSSLISAFVGALLFSFSGYAMFEIGHAAHFIHTICWLPLALLSFEKLKNKFYISWFLIAVTAIAMTVMAGFPQISLATSFILITYSVFLSIQQEKKSKKLRFYFGTIAIGYLLAAPVIIPSFVLSLSSDRVSLSWEAFSSYYVEIKQLLLFYFPYLMGGYYGPYATTPFFANWEGVGNHGFIGFLSLIFALIAIIKCSSNLKSTCYYWLSLSVLSVLIALGPEVESLYRFLFKIPIVNNFRAPERYLFIFSFGVSVLASIGIQTMRKGLIKTKQKRLLIFIFSLVFACFLLASVLFIYPSLQVQAHHKLPSIFKHPGVMIPLTWIVLSLGGLMYWLKQPQSMLRCLIASLLLLSEVLSTVYFSYWHSSSWSESELNNPPSFLTELKKDLEQSNHRYLLMEMPSDQHTRYLWGNFPIYFDLPSAGGYTPLGIHRYFEFLQIANYGAYVGDIAQLQHSQAFNIAGIKYLITGPLFSGHSILQDTTHFKLHQYGVLSVYENLKVLPRVWFTSQVIGLQPDEILEVIHQGKFRDGTFFDPSKTALVEHSQNINFIRDEHAQARIKQLRNGEVLIKTQTQSNQFLILSDVNYPGWKAYIDGKKTKIFCTDYVYRGIILPAGDHIVLFKFEPFYLYIGYAIALLTLLGLVILSWRVLIYRSKCRQAS